VAAAKEPRRLNGSRSGARPPCPPEVSATLIHSHFSSQAGVNAKTFGDFAELFIFCPQKGGRIDKDRGYQVCIDETDAPAVQASSFNR